MKPKQFTGWWWFLFGSVLAVALVALATAVRWAPNASATLEAGADPHLLNHGQDKTQEEVRSRFDQAVVMLHAKQYEMALAALDRVLVLSPRMPEAYVNIGFALIGLGRYEEALGAFQRAIDLHPQQANAYYGLGVAAEGLKDDETALGGMRSFLHLTDASHPFQAKARALIWEIEGRLGRYSPDQLGDDFRPKGPASAPH